MLRVSGQLGLHKKTMCRDTWVLSRHPKTNFSAQRGFICPRETKGRNKKEKQKIEHEQVGWRGVRVFALEWEKGPPLDREETKVAHRKMVTGNIPLIPAPTGVMVRHLILIWHVN